MKTHLKRQQLDAIEFKIAPQAFEPLNETHAADAATGNGIETTQDDYPYTPIGFTSEGYPYSPLQLNAAA